MFWTLFGTLAAGFMGAGFVLILRIVFKRNLPGWAMPISAGLFMLAATISSEYQWFDNTVASLPEGAEVVATREHSAFWQPWTYVAPYVTSFVVVDRATIETNEAEPDLRLVTAYVFTRWRQTADLRLVVDCAENLRADMTEGAELDENGRPIDVTWRDVAADDPLLLATCR